ncbi:HesB/YadR/YfhF family protein [Alicyclobacillus sp. SO9]|uniref:HesB/YadR/YfhF family protein n=1 Tax=Alicyclobacillus sp. SO9 TaxID=2665646 RepID=UPI0018E8CC18|nr:HesB/YadR/YfhF family protein [Alicyclobacillus sp. SO9]QQE77803.1 HesB/YadR/YfhF family protein [Alicyclobacillus sp. SO9]
MNIQMDAKSLQWFHDELPVKKGDGVRFFVRYGGESTVHPAFSLGVTVESPTNVATSVTKHNILFFVREEDAWYFNGNDLSVVYNPDEEEIQFQVESLH